MGVHVDVPAALTIGLVASVSANLGAKFNKRMDPKHLTFYFAVLALFVGLFVPIYGQYQKTKERKEVDNKYLYIAGAGAACGFISGLLGIGGSLFYVPVLMSTTALPHVSVIGTALLSCLLPSLSGTITHYKIGNLDLKKGIILALGTATGGLIGTNAAKIIDEDHLRWAFGVVILLISYKQFRLSRTIKK